MKIAADVMLVAMALGAAAHAAPLGTAFTYQGLLMDNGQPANGPHNIVFRMYDAATDGTLKGTCPSSGTLAVQVTDGLFTVPLDYGDEMFEGDKCWLEIEVNGETITPRQEMTPAPYAMALPGLYTEQSTGNIRANSLTINGTPGNEKVSSTGALEIWVGTGRGLRIENSPDHPNIIGSASTVAPGLTGVTIAGGGGNEVSAGNWATIGGGLLNEGTNEFSTIGGGAHNAAGSHATVSGGWGNNAAGYRTTISGGEGNAAGGDAAFVGGGAYNTAHGSLSTVGGGSSNEGNGEHATVGGGDTNVVNGLNGTVGGGHSNTVTGDYSTIGGGESNEAGNDHATISGGISNSASGMHPTVTGGMGNTATGQGAFVGGGEYNTANGISVTVAGGGVNSATGLETTVGGGQENVADSDWSTVAGGLRNKATGISSTVGGGYGNAANGLRSTVSGGDSGTASGDHATIGGGQSNTSSGQLATIGGGWSNIASGQGYPTVSGGAFNNATGYASTIGGGGNNTAGEWGSTVGGGGSNTANHYMAVVGGGEHNNATGQQTVVGGGLENTASGGLSTIPGGERNYAGGWHSFASGFRAIVRDAAQSGDNWGDQGTFIWADFTDADFESTGRNQFLIRASGGTRIYSNAAANVGVQLAPGGNSWSAISDRNVKENVKTLDSREVLDRLATVPVTEWNLMSQDPSIRHIGPMAQDFHAAFGVGELDTHISSSDADGVALAAIQGLYELAKEKECQIDAYRAEKDTEIAALRASKQNLEDRVAVLEKLVAELSVRGKDGGR